MKISVVIVTVNNREGLCACIDSVLSQGEPDLEVIVVDNGSKEDLSSALGAKFSGVRFLRNEGNLGASKARNQAIALSNGEWILTLDSDTVLEEGFFISFLAFLQRVSPEKRIGIVATKILYPDRKTIYACGNGLTFLRRFYDINRGKRDRQEKSGIRIFGACSAAAFYSRELLGKIKDEQVFDEDFFFMAEDVDLAWRARRRGIGVGFCPGSVALHGGGGSGCCEREKRMYSVRNRFLMIRKNESWLYILAMSPFLFFFECVRFSKFFFHGEAGLYLRALVSFYRLTKEGRGRAGESLSRREGRAM